MNVWHRKSVPLLAGLAVVFTTACERADVAGPSEAARPSFDHTADQRPGDFTICTVGAAGTYNWVSRTLGGTIVAQSAVPVAVAANSCVTVVTELGGAASAKEVTVTEVSHTGGFNLDRIQRDSVIDTNPTTVVTTNHFSTTSVVGRISADFGIVATYIYVARPEGQGCTPGYWKNHTDSWTGYTTGQTAGSVFNLSGFPTLASRTLLATLDGGGGNTLEGAATILLRAAVAALLDAAHPGVNYPRTTSSIITAVNNALASGSRTTILNLAAALDADNNLGCPLN